MGFVNILLIIIVVYLVIYSGFMGFLLYYAIDLYDNEPVNSSIVISLSAIMLVINIIMIGLIIYTFVSSKNKKNIIIQ